MRRCGAANLAFSSDFCRLKDIFADTEISESFPEELFEKAADAVVLEEDGSVGIVLMNGQVIR